MKIPLIRETLPSDHPFHPSRLIGGHPFWAWYVTPYLAHARIAWNAALSMIDAGFIARQNETLMILQLKNGAYLEFKSSENVTGLLGAGLDLLIIDEAADVDDDAYNVYLRPRLASAGRFGMGCYGGTPKGRTGFFHDLYQASLDDSIDPATNQPRNIDLWSTRMSMFESGLVLPEEIEAMRRSMPALAFSQEVMGEFIASSGAVFRDIEACRRSGDYKPQGPGTGGIDIAARKDRTAVCIIDAKGRITDFTLTEPGVRWADVSNTCHYAILEADAELGLQNVVAEQTGVGAPIVEELITKLSPHSIRVTPFDTTNATKNAIIGNLAHAIETQRITWDKDAPWARRFENELACFEYTTSAGGATVMRGKYKNSTVGLTMRRVGDDMVMAAALAASACEALGTSFRPYALTGKDGYVNTRDFFGLNAMRGGRDFFSG